MKHENWIKNLIDGVAGKGDLPAIRNCVAVAVLLAPALAFAGASPFSAGTTALSTQILAILTPVAVIGVMALGAAAWFNKISWGWAAGGIVGMCLVFGGQQIVTWVRGLFGV